ncbi:hypothetical protein [Novacetimonas maltaceti]|uniref:Uncharacterized protein n=1 Tax=Novacetimonas maltaceti TaxID=1203393 RepID=A0A2S3W4S8_9PROT|nr:hypothetical protein [Novacetimonas maltaceti]POF63860.1 hypothetical protein KMAL_03910 [Novacetimonas maltaceti]BCZ75993.1 hypothetical protein [Komagataeibacter phage phiKM1]
MVYQIDDATAVASLPALPTDNIGTPGFFTGGSTSGGAPTRVRYWWLNMVQEELRNLVIAAGLTQDKTNNAQVLAALKVLFVQLGGKSALADNAVFLGKRADVTSGAARVGLFVDNTDFGAIATIGAGNLGQSGSTEQYYQLESQGSKSLELTFNAPVAGVVHAEASANYSSQNTNQSLLSLSINGVTVSSDQVTGTTCMSNGGCAAVSPGPVTISSYCGTSATSPPNIGHTLRYVFVPT